MADGSLIEWTEATWQVVTGCSVVSPGCTNCYAMRLAGTRLQHHPSRAGLTTMSKAGPVWNGKVKLNEQWLTDPLRWKRGRMIFVAAHGDLFHESVPDEWIDKVFAVMALCSRHSFQVLTKRPERMRQYITRTRRSLDLLERHARAIGWTLKFEGRGLVPWPLPNVWLGVSCEDQERADERIPDLLATPAALHFVSLEPLLGPVDLGRIKMGYAIYLNALHGVWSAPETGPNITGKLGWAIIGGESGPGARPMHPQWARDIRDQCATAGVPYFHKQNGAWASVSEVEGGGAHHHFPGGATVRRVGKKLAGRLLDGVEHNEMPEGR